MFVKFNLNYLFLGYFYNLGIFEFEIRIHSYYLKNILIVVFL